MTLTFIAGHAIGSRQGFKRQEKIGLAALETYHKLRNDQEFHHKVDAEMKLQIQQNEWKNQVSARTPR